MKIQKRKVNSKRHTIAWKIGGKWTSRSKAFDLAKKGKIEGVIPQKRMGAKHIRSKSPHTHLYALPTVVEYS